MQFPSRFSMTNTTPLKLTGPIIIIDDDKDDQDTLIAVLGELGLKDIKVFNECFAALQYLSTSAEKPFIILCDINLPRMNGIEFRRAIDRDPFLRKKSIPFIFLSTAANKHQVEEAYELTVQGFFIKQASIKDMEESLRSILTYWLNCVHPNTVR